MPTKTTRPAKRRTRPAPKRTPAPPGQEPAAEQAVRPKLLQWVATPTATATLTAAEQAVRPKFLQSTLYGTPVLPYLLTFLNSPDPHGENAAVRTVVDALSAHGLTEETVELFNTAFGGLRVDHTAGLDLGGASGAYAWGTTPYHVLLIPPAGGWSPVEPVITFTLPAGAVFHLLLSKDPWRLKRCVECQKYFFDETKNGRKKHCSPQCLSRRTTRKYQATRRRTTP